MIPLHAQASAQMHENAILLNTRNLKNIFYPLYDNDVCSMCAQCVLNAHTTCAQGVLSIHEGFVYTQRIYLHAVGADGNAGRLL